MSRITGKVLLYVVPVLLWVPNLFAQAPDTLWTRTYGGADHDEGRSLQETSDLGYIITGYTRAPTSGIYLIKTDTDGNLLWTKTYQTSYLCIGGLDVKQTFDKGYVIVGQTSRPFTYDDIWLIKTDSLGDTLWTRFFGGGLPDVAYSVVETEDSGFVFTYNVHVVSSWWETGLAKFDANGNFAWMKPYGSGESYSLQQTMDGGFVSTGQIHDSLYIRKANELGDTMWTRCYGNCQSVGSSLEQLSDGGYIATGMTYETDVILVRTDSLGNALWAKIYGGDGIDFGEAVIQTSDGGFVITGTTTSFGAGGWDLYLIKTDEYGDTVWTKTYGYAGSDFGLDIKPTFDGNWIITGSTDAFGAGYRDVWLLKFEVNVGIANHGLVLDERFHCASIFRGPLQLPKGKKYKVFDITGRVVEPDKIQPGIYFVEVDGVVIQKVVKVR
jgi:hypothetical protein